MTSMKKISLYYLTKITSLRCFIIQLISRIISEYLINYNLTLFYNRDNMYNTRIQFKVVNIINKRCF